MKVTLREWQTRLSSHFKGLAEGRSAQSGASIFILEHGLTPQELASLSDVIRAHILTSPPLREHELPWMVYAAELGYRYSGDEYWQTFENETPGWIRHAKRDWIRDCFAAFKHRGGAVPSGPWAQHFSIICWPLTHAILPRDLQVQLARLLYEMRFQFSRDLIDSPQELGNLIAHRSFRSSSRFQDFAQQTALIGQIAAALVGDAGRGHRGFLLDSTLLRITTDLEGHRNGREWLARARNEARDRTSLHGLLVPGRGRVADLRNADSVRATEVARREATRLGLEPRLQVRPSDDVGGGWDLLLELPDLSGLLIAFPEFAATLKGSRCTVAGYRGRPLARERLLHSGQAVPLHDWPGPEQVLLHFDEAPWELELLLRTECLLPSARIRVFKIASDGIGYELKRPSVRAGGRYLVVSPDVLTTPIAVTVPIACGGLSAALLDVPAPVTPVWQGQLHQLSIGQLGTLMVWPAGLPAAKWDGEGRVECLTSERTLMAIQSDYPLASLIVHVDRLALVEQRDLSGDKPSYVELPAFPPGRHAVTVSARDHAGREEVGELEFTSREPSFWTPGTSQGAPLLVSVDPPRPSLEDMWEGRASLDVSGPTGRPLTCDIALHDFEGAPALATKRLTNIPLPVAARDWKQLLTQRITTDGNLAALYDAARYLLLRLAAGELGKFELRCLRESTPLRWFATVAGGRRSLTLLDDTGSAELMSANRHTFATPDLACPLNGIDAATILEVAPAGGLYVARRGTAVAAMIIAPIVRALEELNCDPQLSKRERNESAVFDCLRLIELWANARLVGGVLASLRQQSVLQALTRHLVFLLGGNAWDNAERSAAASGRLETLQQAVGTRADEAALASAIWTAAPLMAGQTLSDRVLRFSSLLQTHLRLALPPGEVVAERPDGIRLIDRHRDCNPEHPDWLGEFALRLASDPAHAATWAGASMKAGVSRLFLRPHISRAARFAVLCIAKELTPEPVPAGRVHAGWEWT